MIQKEESLDKKLEMLEVRESGIKEQEAETARLLEQAQEAASQQQSELERISGLSREEAKTYLLSNVENDIRHETVALMKEYEAQLKYEAASKGEGSNCERYSKMCRRLCIGK